MKSEYIAICSKKSLPKIRAFVENELRLLDIQGPTMHELVLAVDEACANSIIHQHSCDGKSRISLTISRRENELLIELHDNGNPFPINEYRPKNLQEIIKKRTKGGLGIFLITQIMDKIEVLEKDKNHVYRFFKYL